MEMRLLQGLQMLHFFATLAPESSVTPVEGGDAYTNTCIYAHAQIHKFWWVILQSLGKFYSNVNTFSLISASQKHYCFVALPNLMMDSSCSFNPSCRRLHRVCNKCQRGSQGSKEKARTSTCAQASGSARTIARAKLAWEMFVVY